MTVQHNMNPGIDAEPSFKPMHSTARVNVSNSIISDWRTGMRTRRNQVPR